MQRAGAGLCPALLCFAALIGLTAAPAFSGDLQAYVVHSPNGYINWTSGLVEVKGIGVPNKTEFGNTPYSDERILSLAQIHAKRYLIDLLQTICVHDNVFVKDLISDNDPSLTQLVDMAYNARELEERRNRLPDGTVEVFLEFKLFGGFAQLVLPEEIKQIQPLSLVVPDNRKSGKSSRKNVSEQAYTGLVVDARGFEVQPAMAPRILDEKGNEIYGATVISREFAVQHGVIRYVRGGPRDDRLPRVGLKPLIVNGLRASGDSRSDIVISNADVAKLKRSTQSLSFLKQCRVVVVLDDAAIPENSQ